MTSAAAIVRREAMWFEDAPDGLHPLIDTDHLTAWAPGEADAD